MRVVITVIAVVVVVAFALGVLLSAVLVAPGCLVVAGGRRRVL